MYSCSSTIRVRYADTDKMQIVNNGKYLEYFEVGRTELLRSLGLPYVKLEEAGILLPLIEANCRYIHPARYDDILRVETIINSFDAPRLRIDYHIYLEDRNELLCSGFTTHVFQNVITGKPVRPPQFFKDFISNFGRI